MEALHCARKGTSVKISVLSHNKGVKCKRFAVAADASAALPLTKWLYGHLGLVPISVSFDPGSDAGAVSNLCSFLSDNGMGSVCNSEPSDKFCFYMFSDDQTAAIAEATGICRKGIGISGPGTTGLEIMPRPIYGILGATYLLDEIYSRI